MGKEEEEVRKAIKDGSLTAEMIAKAIGSEELSKQIEKAVDVTTDLFDRLQYSNKEVYSALKGLSTKGGLGLTTANIEKIRRYGNKTDGKEDVRANVA
jgi:ribosomal protein L18